VTFVFSAATRCGCCDAAGPRSAWQATPPSTVYLENRAGYLENRAGVLIDGL
jgi:hypothetical protein